jgi:DNA-binding transcriptional ArsR family regulator
LPAKKKPKSKPTDQVAKQKESLSQRLIKGLGHPLRVRILAYMNDKPWSPSDLSEELVEGLSQISYHVKVLFDFELIELTGTEPRRGAVEHYYRAVERAFIPSHMAKYIPKSGQQIVGTDILEEIDRDVGDALKAGKFFARDDWHASFTPADLDDQGCKDAEKLGDEFVERFLAIAGESAKRRAESEDGGEHIPVTAAALVFCSAHGETKKAPAKKRQRARKKRN